MLDLSNGPRATVLDHLPYVRVLCDLSRDPNVTYSRIHPNAGTAGRYALVTRGLRARGLAQPALYEPEGEHSYAQMAAGPGWDLQDNPNRNCLALGTDQVGLALGVPISDAPGFLVASRRHRLVVAGTAKWHLVHRTVPDVIMMCASLGVMAHDLLVHILPGATAYPRNDECIGQILARMPFVRDLVHFDARPGDVNGNVHTVNLTELTRRLFELLGVPPESISADDQNTLVSGFSKAAAQETTGRGAIEVAGHVLPTSGGKWKSAIGAIALVD